MNPPQRPQTSSETLTELAKQRNRQAARRTLTAWIQNSIKLLGTGIALDRISLALLRAFPNTSLDTRKFAHVISLGLIAFSIGVLIIAFWQYRIEIQFLEQKDYLYQSSRLLITVTTFAVIVFGLITALIIIFTV